MNDSGPAKYLNILWAGPDCASELSRLHALLFSPSWDVTAFRQLLEHPGSTAFTARAGTPPETNGFIVGRLAADEAEILSLGVCGRWQRQGIGQRLVDAYCRAARKAEARRVYLEVAADNDIALRLYDKLGFEEFGRRKAYYQRSDAQAADAINLSLAI